MFNFIKYSKLYFFISFLALAPGIYSLVSYGLKPAIDFTGGTLLELKIQPQQDQQITESDLSSQISQIAEVSSVQNTGDSYIIRAKPISPEQNNQLQADLPQNYQSVEEVRFETVGPTLGKELIQKTVAAVILASIAILTYVAFQFKELKYGICAVIAMFHDTIILIGVFSLLGRFYGVEVDTLFVTAVLTILSFSVHDTIVVYDRIRESLHRHSRASFKQIVNKAIVETLARSVNNSMTIIFMLTALWLMGGETTRWFVFALLIGTITGTYSSTFTAAPLLVVWDKYISKKR